MTVDEVDQRHAEVIVNMVGLPGSKQVAAPGERDDTYKEGDEELLSPEQATEYRGIVASGSYLVQNRTDIQFAVNELSRRMASPTVADERRMKRLGRYLQVSERVAVQYGYQRCNWEKTPGMRLTMPAVKKHASQQAEVA